jgi:hypothetical protein
MACGMLSGWRLWAVDVPGVMATVLTRKRGEVSDNMYTLNGHSEHTQCPPVLQTTSRKEADSSFNALQPLFLLQTLWLIPNLQSPPTFFCLIESRRITIVFCLSNRWHWLWFGFFFFGLGTWRGVRVCISLPGVYCRECVCVCTCECEHMCVQVCELGSCVSVHVWRCVGV